MANRGISMIEVSEVLYRWCSGVGKKTIAKSLKIARNTVREIIEQAVGLGLEKDHCPEKMEEIIIKLMEYRSKKRLKGNGIQLFLKNHHEQLKIWSSEPYMTVPQMIRLFAEQNILIKETSLRCYLKNNFEQKQNFTVHLITSPGKQAQVDFGYVGMMTDGITKKIKKTYAFVMTLSHSRFRFVRFVFRQDVATWVDCHIRAFNFFNGVPETLLIDNLKSGIIKPDIYDPVLNRTYGELERHYGFIVDAAKVRHPAHKGKVERSIPIVRQQIIAGRNHSDIQSANEYAIKWAREEISQRITRTTGESPWTRFIRDEKNTLRKLPEIEFECPIWVSAKVYRDHHFVYNGSFYSVATQYIGKSLWIRATTRILQCFLDNQLIKTHVLASQKGEWVTDQMDYPESARKFLDKTPEICIQEALMAGNYVYDLLHSILEKSSITNLRKAQAILRLSDEFGSIRLNYACKRALMFENFEYKSIQKILELKLDLEDISESFITNEKLISGSYLRGRDEFSTT